MELDMLLAALDAYFVRLESGVRGYDWMALDKKWKALEEMYPDFAFLVYQGHIRKFPKDAAYQPVQQSFSENA